MSQKKDKVLLRYLEKAERFADLINANCFQGKQIVKPEDLQIVSGETKKLIKDKNGSMITVSRFRDILRVATVRGLFIVVGCENQTNIHYAMPVREMLYDALNYTEQVEQISKSHKENKDLKGSGEFLSGFSKTDKIKPVVTLVLYYGDKPWDGSLDLHGILDFGESENLKEYIPNYRMNLIHAREVDNPDIYQSDLRELFGLMKCASDLFQMEQYVKIHEERFRSVDADLMDVIAEFLGEKKRLAIIREQAEEKKGEKVDMCKAFDQLEERGEQRGKLIGEKIGKEIGKEIGKKEAEIQMIGALFVKLGDMEKVADLLDMPIEKVKRVISLVDTL